MTHQTEPQLICLTCGSINPPNATGCQACVDAARKSDLIPAILLEEPQVCTICGRQDHGIKITEAQKQKHFSRLRDIRASFHGIYCQNCGAYYCWNEKLPKFSFWSGNKKAICQVCKGRVGPGEELLKPDLISKVVAKVKSDFAIKVGGGLAREKWMNDPYQKQILLGELIEVGPQVIDQIFEALEKKNNLYDAFQLARIAEIGATGMLLEQNVEKRLSELPNFHDILCLQYAAIFRLEKASRSGILIPRMIEELLNRKNDVDFRSTLAEKFGEITWDTHIVEGLTLALNDTGARQAEASISGLFTQVPTVGVLAYRSLNKIKMAQNNPE